MRISDWSSDVCSSDLLDAGLPFQAVGVNVSTGDFYAGDLMRKLEHSFGRAGVSLEHLLLEVNENVSTGRRDKVIARESSRIRRSGVRVWLDECGTGQASVNQHVDLKRQKAGKGGFVRAKSRGRQHRR